MFARALIVLLLILNLGVALWWATRGNPAPSVDVALPPGVERLQLLDESADTVVPATPAPMVVPDDPAAQAAGQGDAAPAGDGTGPTGEATDAQAVEDEPGASAAAPVCHSFGPFADAVAAGGAAAQLRPAVLRVTTRQVQTAPRGWNVQLPALPDRAAAEATAARLTAAGFGDHYLLPAADDGTVDIALGRFAGEAAAQRHAAALQAAGFAAVAEPIGDGGQASHWVDISAGEHADLAVLRGLAGAAQALPIDCDPPAAAR